MAYYRLYHINGAPFSGFDEIHAGDDICAIAEAEPLSGAGNSELWDAGRKVKRLSARRESAG